jgi:hypothetical protein
MLVLHVGVHCRVAQICAVAYLTLEIASHGLISRPALLAGQYVLLVHLR